MEKKKRCSTKCSFYCYDERRIRKACNVAEVCRNAGMEPRCRHLLAVGVWFWSGWLSATHDNKLITHMTVGLTSVHSGNEWIPTWQWPRGHSISAQLLFFFGAICVISGFDKCSTMNLQESNPFITATRWLFCVWGRAKRIWSGFSRSVILSTVTQKECVCWKRAARLSK